MHTLPRLQAFAPRSRVPPESGFEIWFAVILDHASQTALWVRYTRLQPASAGSVQVWRVWGSSFDLNDPSFHFAAVNPVDAQAIAISPERLAWGPHTATPDHLHGAVFSEAGGRRRELSWDLGLQHTTQAVDYVPPLLAKLGIAGTSSNICSVFAKANGKFNLDGREIELNDASAVLTHIWGRRRVDTLNWLYAPRFEQSPERGIEIAAVKPNPWMPLSVLTTLKQGEGEPLHTGPVEMLRGSVQVRYPEVFIEGRVGGFLARVTGRLDVRQVTRYIYRDPSGRSRYIAHSDSGQITCELERDGKRVWCDETRLAAVEFHGLEPWDSAPYLDGYR